MGGFLILGFILDLEQSMITFLLWLDSICYNVYTSLYKTFLNLSNINIFVDGAFDNLLNNVYLIIGIISLFVFSIMLLKMIIDPDADKSGKQVIDMVKRFFLAIILIVFLPTIFDFLADFQNSILAYNVIPNFILGSKSSSIDMYDEDGNYTGKKELSMKDSSILMMQTYANNMTVKIIEGLMYPIDDNGNIQDDIVINASKFFKGSTKAWIYGLTCAAGILVGVATVGSGTGVAVLACGLGGVVGNLGITIGEAVTANHYTWSYAKAHMIAYGDFSQITLFANAIQQGDMHYTALISTFVAGFLVYMIASFCIDLVIRSAKLAFYEVIAPLCLLLSVIPKQKDLVGKWFKVLLTTWAEIFIRIATMCSVALLVGKINFENLNLSIFHPIVSTFVICGVVLFAKQLPKILSQLTGIDSGNMKLNLREKLSDGGAYAAGGVVLGGAKRLSRGITDRVKNNLEQDENGRWRRKQGVSWGKVIRSGALGVVTSVPSVVRTQIGAGVKGYKAKNFKDMISGVNDANASAEASIEKTKKYIADHGGTLEGVGLGLLTSGFDAFKNYIGLQPDFSALKEQKEALDDIAKVLQEIKAVAEDQIDKHMYEYYSEGQGVNGNLTKQAIDDYNKWKKQLDEESKKAPGQQNQTLMMQLQNDISQFENKWQDRRLDVLQAKTKSSQGVNETDAAYALRIANANNDFNEARKKLVDSFVSDVPSHLGAEEEALKVAESIKTINKQLQDYSDKAVVRAFHDGVQGVFNATQATSTTVGTAGAADFIKKLKKATEVTDANISRQYNELQRKNKKSGTSGGK